MLKPRVGEKRLRKTSLIIFVDFFDSSSTTTTDIEGFGRSRDRARIHTRTPHERFTTRTIAMESTGVRTIDHMEVEYEDLDVGQEADVSIAKDGGCMKKVLAKGSGDERPQIGNEVTVHYTGTLLDGTKFDSSVDRGDPFKFKLGVGQVIKGWDEGVASMRKGEKAILTCTPEYAYGAAGSPPTIPANSTLKFEVELFSWTNDNDLYKDGGIVLAKTLKKADGYTFAKERDEVKVTYSVAASDADVVGGGDTIVPSTEAEFVVKDAPFDGMRALLAKIKEGDSGIYKMKNVPGGRQYCTGLPGDPQSADVTVTLNKVITVEPICGGAGSKKATTEGEGYEQPNDGASVTISYTVTLDDGKHTLVDSQSEFTFETGNEAVPAGLEEAVMRMKKGEVAEVKVPAAFAYGGDGATLSKGVVPPNTNVVYNVTLSAFEKEKETYEMSTAEKLEACEKVKGAGNDAYKSGKLELAFKKYDKAMRYVEYDSQFTDDEKKASKKLKLSIHLNTAAVAIKDKKYSKARKASGEALDIESGNEKALYRRAQAATELEEYDEAEADVKKLIENDEGHKEARNLLAKIKRAKHAQAKKDAKVFGGMFSKLGGLYKEEPKIKEVDVKAAAADAPMDPVDIGNGFQMEEITDPEPDMPTLEPEVPAPEGIDTA